MKKYKILKGTPISYLHEKLILDILCFLPAKSIIRCSCVCKDWANLIYQPSFPREYFSRGKAPLQLVLKIYENVVVAQFDEALYTARSPSNYTIRKKSIFDINIHRILGIPNSFWLDFVICEVTGWILVLGQWRILARDPLFKTFRSRFHMYNPITGQHMVVQHAIRDNGVPWNTGALIFAQKTNQLKLLGYYRTKQRGIEAYIQTIGTNTWRSVGELPYSYGLFQPVSLNGLCHWLDHNSEVIHSFDPEKEIFEVIQTPPWCKEYFPGKLGSLDGCLCLSFTKSFSRECEIWVMHEYGVQDSWTKNFVLSDIAQYLRPLACLKNGEILMLKGGDSKTIRYDWEECASMLCFDRSSRKYRHVGIRKGWKKEMIEE